MGAKGGQANEAEEEVDQGQVQDEHGGRLGVPAEAEPSGGAVAAGCDPSLN